ncbi:SIS domain-containing protein [Streptomyces spiramenti]|uniref:Sugar isomerase n=1 Tax=Streptomyces spiramenti TaxID=2720606 RepID=A0ABX1APK7_9ACTN|nr:sugar isomerase [Streptomyces spiramenti]NJP68071.1 sugar isomerase [Streptomyces spiramenti]
MSTAPGSYTAAEIASQPDCWRRAAELAATVSGALPASGERIAVVGCGTSWFIAQSYAALREASGAGESDAWPASGFPVGRRYDRVVLLSRSGTTTEVLDLAATLQGATPTTAVVADAASPLAGEVDQGIVLGHADERSVVQTRFATSALALLRAGLGERLDAAVADAERALAAGPPPEAVAADQVTFLGSGWCHGLAQEAALKLREAAGAWTEAYPAMEYRHGPVSITEPGRAVWVFGALPRGLAADVAATGGELVAGSDPNGSTRTGTALSGGEPLDPMADLVRTQLLALAVAGRRGLDADRPRHLARSVILRDR